MKRSVLLLLMLTLVVTALSPRARSPALVREGDRTGFTSGVPGFIGWVPDQIIVQFEPAAAAGLDRGAFTGGRTGLDDFDALSRRHGAITLDAQYPGAQPVTRGGRRFDMSVFFRVTFAGPLEADRVAREYAELPGVVHAEPIGIHKLYATPNDDEFAGQWHLHRSNDADVDAPEAWDVETGDEAVIVAVLDSGIRYFHKDLGGADASYANPTDVDGNMWINQAEKNGSPGVDDDNNGFVDDWIGWDWVDGAAPCFGGEDCAGQDNDPRDFNGHGTHCAGSVAAINNNGYAAAAVAGGWSGGVPQGSADGVEVMACRVAWSGRYLLNEVGMVRMDFAAQALYYAADNGARIASCSWFSSDSGGLAAAVDYFVAAGGLVFHAAGNDGADAPDYLGGRADVVNVAATDNDDCLAGFSNYGDWVDVCAPGEQILSLYHDHDVPQLDAVAEITGTSMAAPIAAAVAALVWSLNPYWTAARVRQLLEESCDDIDGLPCNRSHSGQMGAGRVNAHRAVLAGVATAAGGARGGRFGIDRVYPNPFNPVTTLRFTLDGPAAATVEVFDVRGRRVVTLFSGRLPAGPHELAWNAADQASGVYFVRLTAAGRAVTRRLVLLK